MTPAPGNRRVIRSATLLQTLIFFLWGTLLGGWIPAQAQDGAKAPLVSAQDAVRLSVDRYGPNAIETVASRLALAELYIVDGDFPKAEPLLQQALNITVRVNGNNHKSLLPILERLAWIDIRNNRFSSGKQFYSDAVEISRRVNGNNNPITLKLLDSLADARQKERSVGNQAAVRKKQTQSPQGTKDPTYELVIANQNQPPPAVTPATASKPPEAPGNEPAKTVEKHSSVSAEHSAVPTTAVSSTEKPAPAANSPFASSVDGALSVERHENQVRAAQVQNIQVQNTQVQGSSVAAVGATAGTGTESTAATQANSPPAERTGWFISVGCFSESSNSDEQMAAVRKLGLRVYTKQRSNSSMICVFSGPYSRLEEAEEAKKDLATRGGITDAYIRAYN
ncbi:MAG: SPOR domain-containing protein [Magnetococcales bacterium]|nr:SPOR domain-containing protein [Magnetococcales bacterium]